MIGLVPFDRLKEILGEVELLFLRECKDMVEEIPKDHLEDLCCRGTCDIDHQCLNDMFPLEYNTCIHSFH